jgi:hypothetical protein
LHACVAFSISIFCVYTQRMPADAFTRSSRYRQTQTHTHPCTNQTRLSPPLLLAGPSMSCLAAGPIAPSVVITNDTKCNPLASHSNLYFWYFNASRCWKNASSNSNDAFYVDSGTMKRTSTMVSFFCFPSLVTRAVASCVTASTEVISIVSNAENASHYFPLSPITPFS